MLISNLSIAQDLLKKPDVFYAPSPLNFSKTKLKKSDLAKNIHFL